jgi:hypothetical protein
LIVIDEILSEISAQTGMKPEEISRQKVPRHQRHPEEFFGSCPKGSWGIDVTTRTTNGDDAAMWQPRRPSRKWNLGMTSKGKVTKVNRCPPSFSSFWRFIRKIQGCVKKRENRVKGANAVNAFRIEIFAISD